VSLAFHVVQASRVEFPPEGGSGGKGLGFLSAGSESDGDAVDDLVGLNQVFLFAESVHIGSLALFEFRCKAI
jgi:hypothetical protein